MAEESPTTKRRKGKNSDRKRARRPNSWSYSAPSWEKSPRRFPSGHEIELWALRREIDFQKSEVERVNHVLRFQKWAIGELCDYLDAELKPGQLTSWQRYRRLVCRLREV